MNYNPGMGRLTRQWIFGGILVASLTLGPACTQAPDAATPEAERLNQLYLELQRKHTRSMERFGFSLEYAAEPPQTIVITLRYDPTTEKGMQGKDVAAAAARMVRSTAAREFGLPNVRVRSENIRLTQPE